jgi:hypothetical protein
MDALPPPVELKTMSDGRQTCNVRDADGRHAATWDPKTNTLALNTSTKSGERTRSTTEILTAADTETGSKLARDFCQAGTLSKEAAAKLTPQTYTCTTSGGTAAMATAHVSLRAQAFMTKDGARQSTFMTPGQDITYGDKNAFAGFKEQAAKVCITPKTP